MYGLLNVASLVLGLAAWALPVAALCGKKPRPGFYAASFALCAVSLELQIFYSQHLVVIRDWSAMEDIHGAVAFAAGVLLTGTILLNILSALLGRKR